MKILKLLFFLTFIIACSSPKKISETVTYSYNDNVNYDSKRIYILYGIHVIKQKAFCTCVEDVKGKENLDAFYKNDLSMYNSEPGIEGFGFYGRKQGIINGTQGKATNTLYLVDSLVQKEAKHIITTMHKDQHTYNEGRLVNAAISSCYSLSTSRVIDSIIRTNMIYNNNYTSDYDGIKFSKDKRLHEFMAQILDIDKPLPDYYSFSKYMDEKYNH